MRKRPLCFLCLILVLLMWILKTSEDSISSEVYDSESVLIYGKIYQCEYKEEHLILYLKQTVLSEFSKTEKLNHIRITCKAEDSDYQVADIISVKGDMKKMKAPTNPGQFDVRSYYNAQKVQYTMWEPEITLLERPSVSFLRGLTQLRTMLAKQYDQILPNQYGALLKGISLGDKTDISEEIKELFQTGGISHILAISALHLQILGSSLYKLLRKCKIPVGIAAVFSGVFLTCYGILTGASVATLRALIMFLINVGADVTGRTYDAATGMAIAAVVLTAGNPDYLAYSGFWLSFFAVCSFMIFKEKRKLAGGILLYFFMAPIMLIYFYELSPYSVCLNLIVVPTVGMVLISGLFGCFGSMIHLTLGKILVFPSVTLLHIYKNLCEVSEKLPANTLTFGKPTWMQVFLYYMILGTALYFFRKNRLKKRRVIAFLFMIPACLILTWRGMQGLQITMLDIGQGDSLVIKTETGHTYLIDGGSTSEELIGQYKILPYLKYSGVDELEAVFITHPDSDHMNGILELMELIKEDKTNLVIKRIVLPVWEEMSAFEEIYQLSQECEIEIYQFEKGGEMTDGDMRLTCLHPNGEDYKTDMNEGSLVLRLDYKGFSMLLTGDLEGEAETNLLGEYGDVDVLKVAHHGSGYSTSELFLQETQPEICVISVGENNRYGHPHEDLLERLEQIGAAVFQTSKGGALTIRTDGEKIDLKTYKQYNEP